MAAGVWMGGRGVLGRGGAGAWKASGRGGGLELLIRFELSPNIKGDLLSVN